MFKPTPDAVWHKGCGVVTFASPEEAECAVRYLGACAGQGRAAGVRSGWLPPRWAALAAAALLPPPCSRALRLRRRLPHPPSPAAAARRRGLHVAGHEGADGGQVQRVGRQQAAVGGGCSPSWRTAPACRPHGWLAAWQAGPPGCPPKPGSARGRRCRSLACAPGTWLRCAPCRLLPRHPPPPPPPTNRTGARTTCGLGRSTSAWSRRRTAATAVRGQGAGAVRLRVHVPVALRLAGRAGTRCCLQGALATARGVRTALTPSTCIPLPCFWQTRSSCTWATSPPPPPWRRSATSSRATAGCGGACLLARSAGLHVGWAVVGLELATSSGLRPGEAGLLAWCPFLLRWAVLGLELATSARATAGCGPARGEPLDPSQQSRWSWGPGGEAWLGLRGPGRPPRRPPTRPLASSSPSKTPPRKADHPDPRAARQGHGRAARRRLHLVCPPPRRRLCECARPGALAWGLRRLPGSAGRAARGPAPGLRLPPPFEPGWPQPAPMPARPSPTAPSAAPSRPPPACPAQSSA